MKNTKILGAAISGRRSEQTKSVSPRQFLNLSQADKGRIEHVRVVAPKLGDGATFGHIELTYK